MEAPDRNFGPNARVDTVRDELATTTADLVSAQAAAARKRAVELQDELTDARRARPEQM